MTFFRLEKKCSWWIRSESDSRWNCDGEGTCIGMICLELDNKLEELKKNFGEPPKDVTVGFMKD